MQEITKASKIIYQGKILNLRLDEVSLPSGRNATREVVEHSGAVVIIPVFNDDRIAIVKQYRKPVDEILYELPAGKLEKGEEPLACAKRELLEETGYAAEEFTLLSHFYTTPGFSNEIIYLFLAKGLQIRHQQLEQDEFLELCLYSYEDLIKKVFENRIKDAKTIIGLLWLRLMQLGD